MKILLSQLVVIIAGGATAFSPDGRLSGSRGLPPSAGTTTTRRRVAFVSIVNRHAQGTIGYADDDVPKDGNRSEMGKFVSAMRDMYSDLKDGGGSIRRQMNGVGFTYVSPVISSTGGNKQLDGAWRHQKPTLVGVDEDLSDIQRGIIQERFRKAQSSSTHPLLVYLPGLDGFGISATAQFDDLSKTFEFWRMTVNLESTHVSFSDLVVSVVKFVTESASIMGSIDSPREVIIVGESFGGLLACAVAMALKNGQSNTCYVLKGMVLVNPATSFDETIWERVVPVLTSLRYLESQEKVTDDSEKSRFAFLNSLPTPYSVMGALALAATVPSGTQYSSILNFLQQTLTTTSAESMLSASLDGFGILAEYLSPAMLDQRVMKWIPVGSSVVNNPQRLSKLNVPTLIIGGRDDKMLPTRNEAERLGQLLPNCVVMDIAGAGHFLLDTGFNLTEVLIDSHINPLNSKKENYDPISDWMLPPDDIVKAVIKKRVVPLRERTSPVFFSTDPVTGKRRRGLSHIPSTKKPLLFVANHQLFGLDLGMIISELLEQRGIMARGLAHPVAMEGFAREEQMTGLERPIVRKQKRRWEFNDEDSQFQGDLFSMFGAVKVSPRNFYHLLQTNQTMLLFPGGVREVFHRKGEAYQIFWPEKTDFVRLAAKFNTIIVPLAAIGAADSAEMVLDAPELLQLPFGLGASLANFSSSTVSARFDAQNEDELFIPPLTLPKPFPARHYFLFGKPFDTSSLDPKNLDACQDVYKAIESELKYDISALLEARKDDPFALDGIKRTSYQRLFGKDPPTFPLDSLKSSM
ncbi:hypothetical protein ACHAXA_002021 [Cyclostephanos tholiformis]|uniref:AB hydrolase-1 domain-containing protein n=1 Tax=Cyclostephanos tholiformis TaxID=382380 RepID=A0ABD3SSC4_9STRA